MESSIALPANIRLEWKSIEVSNSLAYYDMATITAVKGFIVQAPGVSLLKARMAGQGQTLKLIGHILYLQRK
jgi:hypothetical protein